MHRSTLFLGAIASLCVNATTAFYTPSSRPFAVDSAERIVKSICREKKRKAREDCDDYGTDRNRTATRDLEMLMLWEWAKENGVEFSDKIHLKKDEQGLFGVALKSPLDADDCHVLMEIPDDLVLSSTMLDPNITEKVAEFYSRLGYQGLPAQPCLMLVVLQEYKKGKASRWYPYFQSLPETFDISLRWNEEERTYAEALGLESTVEHIDRNYDHFEQLALQLFPGCPEKDMEWAFSAVMQRSWRATYTAENGAPVANLVCAGDMFNHRKNGTVGVSHRRGGSVLLVSTGSHNEGDGLYMDYFGEGTSQAIATKCVAQYGFCDESDIPAAFLMQEIAKLGSDNDKMKEKFKTMGFFDYAAMSFHSDGTVSRHLWDAALYLELRYLLSEAGNYVLGRSNSIVNTAEKPKHNCTTLLPDLQLCERALLTKDTDDIALRSLHKKYRPEVARTLLQSAQLLLEARGPLSEEKGNDANKSTWKLLRRFHQHQLETHENVCANLRREIAAFD